jgi:hypothetical protein
MSVDHEIAYLLRTVDARRQSYGGFQWPAEVGARVEPDTWDPTAECGSGIHGLLSGVGDGSLLNWDADAIWQVVSCDATQVVALGGKVKVPWAVLECEGSRDAAVAFLVSRVGPVDGMVAGAATAGDRGTATAGYAGTASAGYAGTATAGDRGTATAGDRGTATAGYAGTATAGYAGTARAGYAGTATAGYAGTATAGYVGTATAGYAGTARAGYAGTATAGDRGTATAGDRGTATAGYAGTASAGYAGTATAGDRGTATSRYRARAGSLGVILVLWWDAATERERVAVGYVGEAGIEPDTWYEAPSGVLVKMEESER